MSSAPLIELPDLPPDRIATGTTRPRYEDVAQDGRMRMEGIWPPMGPLLWGGQLGIERALSRLGARGIRAVLARVILWGGSEPISVRNPVEHELRYDFAHSVDASGNVDRILFDTWLDSHAPRGIENDPGRASPEGAPRVQVARAYGQHVFTKPAAPPGQHRVTALDDPELPAVPDRRSTLPPAGELVQIPSDASALEPELRQDDAPIAFGLAHTDGNQHVNFLAYPRLFEDAALRRLSALGSGSRLLARAVEVRYRKPCFAGDRVRIALRAYRQSDGFGLSGGFWPEGASPETDLPLVTARLLLSP